MVVTACGSNRSKLASFLRDNGSDSRPQDLGERNRWRARASHRCLIDDCVDDTEDLDEADAELVTVPANEGTEVELSTESNEGDSERPAASCSLSAL